MNMELADRLMDEFAARTGLVGSAPPRRYLWTDAFAVRNFLILHQLTERLEHRQHAVRLVDQVHHVLGQHRGDDPRTGWISGLSPAEGEAHPTCGGLRIGKPLPERRPGEPMDERLEWERDGQYFHYLTRWMQALLSLGVEWGDHRYVRWAAELASVATERFTIPAGSQNGKRMVWKMSIDLSRPLVASMGHHDPLEGWITCLEIQLASSFDGETEVDLGSPGTELWRMCQGGEWASHDPLGIGGLLEVTARLARLVERYGVPYRTFLIQLVDESVQSLEAFSRGYPVHAPAHRRLAFRELGLAIGLHAMKSVFHIMAKDREMAVPAKQFIDYYPLANSIEQCWAAPSVRQSPTWLDHQDINEVMLATALLQADGLADQGPPG